MLEHEIMLTALGEEVLDEYLEDPMTYADPLPIPQTVNEVQQAALHLTNEQVIAATDLSAEGIALTKES